MPVGGATASAPTAVPGLTTMPASSRAARAETLVDRIPGGATTVRAAIAVGAVAALGACALGFVAYHTNPIRANLDARAESAQHLFVTHYPTSLVADTHPAIYQEDVRFDVLRLDDTVDQAAVVLARLAPAEEARGRTDDHVLEALLDDATNKVLASVGGARITREAKRTFCRERACVDVGVVATWMAPHGGAFKGKDEGPAVRQVNARVRARGFFEHGAFYAFVTLANSALPDEATWGDRIVDAIELGPGPAPLPGSAAGTGPGVASGDLTSAAVAGPVTGRAREETPGPELAFCATGSPTKCDPSGKILLACQGAVWTPIKRCVGETGCTMPPPGAGPDAPAICDLGPPEPGDKCDLAMQLVCARSGKAELLCKNGFFETARRCAGGCAMTDHGRAVDCRP
jgi:hypothetical protein